MDSTLEGSPKKMKIGEECDAQASPIPRTTSSEAKPNDSLTAAQRRQQFLDNLEREQKFKAQQQQQQQQQQQEQKPNEPQPKQPQSTTPQVSQPEVDPTPSPKQPEQVQPAPTIVPSSAPSVPTTQTAVPSAPPDNAAGVPREPSIPAKEEKIAPSVLAPAAPASNKPAAGNPILRRLKKELADLEKDPPPGCSAMPDPSDFYRWEAIIAGPPGTPYEGGIFRLQIKFPTDYPFKPPKVQFLTKVYNQHVKDTGEICLDILKESWSPTLNVSRLLVSITSLLTDPNPDFALDLAIAQQYKTDRAAYDRTVREWVQKYA